MLVAFRTGEAATRGQDRDCLELGGGSNQLSHLVSSREGDANGNGWRLESPNYPLM